MLIPDTLKYIQQRQVTIKVVSKDNHIGNQRLKTLWKDKNICKGNGISFTIFNDLNVYNGEL